ncbi:Nn.00g013680.m01.CDS01 [Neocucurbitaria sp. VM-36]
MLKYMLNAPKCWVSSLGKRQTVYQQWTHADTTELQILAAEPSNRSEKGIANISYRPHSPASRTTSLLNAPKAKVGRYLGARFTGWRFGVLNFAIWASVVFLINLIVTIWGSTATLTEKGVFLDGECAYIKKLNSGLHVLINILSTILLSGSNYCMQCLSAPTRAEVDWAHGNMRRTWLDIGVPGLRNLRHISRWRSFLWCLLGLSSFPLHLLYNSAVYSSISSNSYWAYSVSQSFINDTQCLNCTNGPDEYSPYQQQKYSPTTLVTLWNQARAGNLDRLDPSECLTQYAQTLQSNRRNLLLVAGDGNFPPPEENYFVNGSRVYWGGMFSADSVMTGPQGAAESYRWICSGVMNQAQNPCANVVDTIKEAPNSWRVGYYCDIIGNCTYSRWPVEYCLSEKAQPHCKLHFEPNIAIAITILNFVKAALMFHVAFGIHAEPLMTMGDAVASFLAKNDPFTKNMCISSLKDFKRSKNYIAGPRQWNDKRYRWKDVTSKTRRIMTLLMFLIALIIVGVLLAWGLKSLPENTTFSRLGFGTVDPSTSIIGLPNELISNVLLANTPQLILSFLYFSYNALFTAMLLGYEWTTYAAKRKGLRVSHRPSGEQRSTYFLQLPYRFGMPLMGLSGALHWLVSQSIFLEAIDFYDEFGAKGSGATYSDENFTTLGFSPSAIISVIVLGSLMVISIVGFGYVPYRRGMPLAGSCSMAISAACHNLGQEETDGDMAAEKKLQWGVVSMGHDGVGHCAFSTNDVEAPVKGEVYAGDLYI